MSEKLVECVPNFSEGRDSRVIEQIADAIESVDGVKVLDVNSSPDMNRTVVTFLGIPQEVAEAAFLGIEKASQLIDMRIHKGLHPRMGATDVCSLVPFSGITVEECISLSDRLARRTGEDLGIPVYLYEESARVPERKNLSDIRAGEYEGLQSKLADPRWKPDYGPHVFNARTGATVIGVRDFLIAYNINLNTREAGYATDIAFELRSKGRSARRGNTDPACLSGEEILKYRSGHYPCGRDDFVGTTIQQTIQHCRQMHGYDLAELLRSHRIDPEKPEGRSVKIPGRFPHCRAMGWYVRAYDRAQVSLNLTNYRVTSLHVVFEETRRLADQRGLTVTGSEIVGMVPFQALYETGVYYLKKQGRSARAPIEDVLSTAVQSLGLTDVADFKIEARVLGLSSNSEGALTEMKLSNSVAQVSGQS